MTPSDIFLGVLTLGVIAIAWKLWFGSKATDDGQMTREMLENLRRDLTDTKDKLSDRMGENAEGIQKRLESTLKLVNQQLSGMDQRIDTRVSDINTRLDAAAKMMGMVQKQYGTVENLSGDIKRLQEAFKAPKPRGGFSEKALVDLASQMLPTQKLHPQFTFKTGSMVDLMIETSSGRLCIDAKFPLENFLKLLDQPDSKELQSLFINDVKKHIRDVAKKYILPEEGTLDSACMYVPSDSVMYEILRSEELTDLANSLRVTLLSPHTFQAFLNVLYAAYQSQQFAENAEQVLALIRGIQQQSSKLGDELQVLQKHVSNASSKMADVTSEHSRLDMHIGQASQIETGDRKIITKTALERTLKEPASK